ncbi:Uncharacterized protein APZ42_007527 [Daphnia magna]|uniref:Uncharacterized protein n=1 Tax=Daphnia magna TaxID=35525 RepID=A0A162BU90_9CRUS|nr:Uncharacterized protein APZ42_007527 [Daphnia magna]
MIIHCPYYVSLNLNQFVYSVEIFRDYIWPVIVRHCDSCPFFTSLVDLSSFQLMRVIITLSFCCVCVSCYLPGTFNFKEYYTTFRHRLSSPILSAARNS